MFVEKIIKPTPVGSFSISFFSWFNGSSTKLLQLWRTQPGSVITFRKFICIFIVVKHWIKSFQASFIWCLWFLNENGGQILSFSLQKSERTTVRLLMAAPEGDLIKGGLRVNADSHQCLIVSAPETNEWLRFKLCN